MLQMHMYMWLCVYKTVFYECHGWDACAHMHVCECTLLEKVCANPGEVFMYFVCIKTLVKKYANSVCIGYIYIFFNVMYIFNI